MGTRTQTLRHRTTRILRPGSESVRLRDRFELLVPLGSGGFGTVWEGFDMLLERPVAIKELLIDEQLTNQADALREARATARLNHPAIVSLYEVIAEEDRIHLISEMVDGFTLEQMISRGQLSDNDCGRIGYALCEALAHAHQQGVVHRDIKPSNVMVARDWLEGSGGWRVQPAKLMDFGIASIVGPGARGGLEQAGPHAGSRGYLAPEQAAGLPAAPSADVYSLALVMFECFTGEPPGRGRRSRLGRLRRELPANLTATIDRCLQQDPQLRPGIGELGAAIHEALPELSHQIASPTIRVRLRGLLGRRRQAAPSGRRIERDAASSGRLMRPARAAVGAVLCSVTMLAAQVGLSPFAPALAAALLLLMPRAGWVLAATSTALWLAATGQPGSALLLVPAALLVAFAAILPAYRVLDGALSGAALFCWTAALQAMSGLALPLAQSSAAEDPAAASRYPDVALHSLTTMAERADLASLALWALCGAGAALLTQRRAQIWAWAMLAGVVLTAQIAIGQTLERTVPSLTIIVGTLFVAALCGVAFVTMRAGRVHAERPLGGRTEA